jgi:hypothetical protein
VSRDEIHHVAKIVFCSNKLGLASRFLGKAGRARIRNPHFNPSQAKRAQLGVMRGNA